MSVTGDDLFELLSVAAWRIKGLDASSRQHVLRQVLTERLSGTGGERRKELLFELLQRFELSSPSEALLANPVPKESAVEEKVPVTPPKKEPNIFDVITPSSSQERTVDNQAQSNPMGKEDVRRAFNESIERMLNALNPEYLRTYVKKRTMQSDKAYKAELFDSYEEKFVQLVAYHEKGRLFKDFWALFRESIKK